MSLAPGDGLRPLTVSELRDELAGAALECARPGCPDPAAGVIDHPADGPIAACATCAFIADRPLHHAAGSR